MLDFVVLVAVAWSLTPVQQAVVNELTAADEATLKGNGLKVDNNALLVFFNKRTLQASDTEAVRKLIRQLGSESYRLREQALADLIARGPMVVEMLHAATRDDNLEIARRAEKALTRIHERDVAADVVPAAVRLLAVPARGHCRSHARLSSLRQ